MIWILTGSRHGRNGVEDCLFYLRSQYGKPSLVLVGDAPGVDAQVRGWIKKQRDIPMVVFHAAWGRGKIAGPERNYRMVDYGVYAADKIEDLLCIAIPQKGSTGTLNCYNHARKVGIAGYWLDPNLPLPHQR